MCSATSMWLSPNGCDGSTRGSGAEDARRCTGWDASRSGTPISSSCGNSVCDRRLEGRSRMTRESHVRFSEGGGVRSPSATRLVVLIHAHKRHDWLIGAVNKRLREEFAKLQVEINDEKSRIVDLERGESFAFLGSTSAISAVCAESCGRTTRPGSKGGRRCCGSSRRYFADTGRNRLSGC